MALHHFRRYALGILLALAGSMLVSACATFDPYDGVPNGAYKSGPGPFTLADLARQKAAAEGCYRFADETNPSDRQMMAAFAKAGGTGGLIGGGAGTTAAAAIVGVAVTLPTVAAGAVSYALAAGAVNAANGHIYYKVLLRSSVQQCLMMEAVGVHSIKPSDIARLESGEVKEIAIPGALLPADLQKAAAITAVARPPSP